MIKVLQFADIINRYDFADLVTQHADPKKFQVDVCLRSSESNIASPVFPKRTRYRLIEGNSRRDIVRTAWRLSKLLKEWKIDILHAHHYDQAVISWLALKMYPQTKFIFGRHYSDSVQNLPGLNRSFYLNLEQLINHRADRIIVPSSEVFDILTKEQGIDGSKIDVIRLGFAPEKYTSLADEKIRAIRDELATDGKFVIANFGKWTKGKGVNFLFDAVVKLRDKIPNLMALFVGEGEERSYLETKIAKHNLSATIKLLGWRTDAMEIMANVDVVVQPSLSESFCQVMVEAMWIGKPIVITDVGGPKDIIETGKNGIIVPKANAQALADAIENLFKNEELRKKLSINGRKYVETHLSIEKIIKDYENSYLKTLNN